MFVYENGKKATFVNLDHAHKLTILPDGFGRWCVVAYLAGGEKTILSEYSSYNEAEEALRRIAAAVKAGCAVYDPTEEE